LLGLPHQIRRYGKQDRNPRLDEDVTADSFRSVEVSSASNFHCFARFERNSITQLPALRLGYVMQQDIASRLLHTRGSESNRATRLSALSSVIVENSANGANRSVAMLLVE
jgi:hypothetical protein